MARGISRRGFFGLLDDIGQILKANESKEGQQASERNAGQCTGLKRRRIHERSNDRNVDINSDSNNRYQSSRLDQRKHARDDHRFQNSPGRHGTEPDHKDDDDQASREIDELLNIPGRSQRNGGRRNDRNNDRQ